MGFFDFLKKRKNKPSEKPAPVQEETGTNNAPIPQEKTGTYNAPIPEDQKQYYKPEEYYSSYAYPMISDQDWKFGNRDVITFDERKNISYPSSTGLYVQEILLLEYCTYGTYPNPKNGYPGFWWFEYGIRNVGQALQSLEDRGYIRFSSAMERIPKMTIPQLKELAANHGIRVSGRKQDIIDQIIAGIQEEELEQSVTERKYCLTEKGKAELQENGYVPYMHKCHEKTVDSGMFGPVYNVWEVNRRMGNSGRTDWQNIISEIQEECHRYRVEKERKAEEFYQQNKDSFSEETIELHEKIKEQDRQFESINNAELNFKKDGDIDALIAFWEGIWSSGGLLFRGSKHMFRLPDLYIRKKRYDDALKILERITDPDYQYKVDSYIGRIEVLKKKNNK